MWDSHKNCTGDVLARYFARLYGTAAGADTALYDLQAKDLGTFMEPNLAGTVRYPDGIKLVVATFTSLFGTENGRKVQSFCKKWGWVLAWALSTNGAERFALDSRVIDPEVFAVATASHNATVSAEVQQLRHYLARFSRIFQRHPTPHAPCAVFYLERMLIGR